MKVSVDGKSMYAIHCNWFPPKGYRAITIGNVMFYRGDRNLPDYVIRHELIHWQQEKECLIIFFYLLYVWEFILLFLYVWNWHFAYRSISFENEAYTYQHCIGYLRIRKHYIWRHITDE